MTQSWNGWYWHLGVASWLAIGAALAAFGDCALAQIAPDGTLPNNSIVTPQGNTSLIEGGTQAGSNLFHSFEQFSVPTGGAAYFNNASAIQNIISRVTGGSVSNIDGLLRANGTANLFLLNPNGIIFGPNASLNIGGSFLGSTASGLNFADGTQFSATAPQTTPLLTVSVPLGLQYGGNAGSILNQSQTTNSSAYPGGLQVQPDKTLALVGGDVRLDGGIMHAPGGQVELGGVAGAGTVGLQVDGNNLRLSFPDGVARADVTLTNGAGVDVIAEDGGSIAINARNLNVLGGSTLKAGIGAGLGSISNRAGDIKVDATDKVTIEGASGSFSEISNVIYNGASGNAGNIAIYTGSLNVTGDTGIGSYTNGQGNAGSVTIRARDAVSFSGNSAVLSTVGPLGIGDGSDISIQARSLSLSNNAQLSTGTLGQGNSGNIQINATESVSVSSGSFVQAATLLGATGAGGDLTVETGRLSVSDGAYVFVTTSGEGKAGNLLVQARDSVEVVGAGSYLSANVYQGASGTGGNVTLETGRLSVRDGAQIQAGTSGAGSGGTLKVNASESVELSGTTADGQYSSGLFTTAEPGASGAGGNLTVETGRLSVSDGAAVSAATSGQGRGGNLTVAASESVELSGSSVDGQSFSRLASETFGAGDAGDLTIATGRLLVGDGAFVSVGTRPNSEGKGGTLAVTASDAVELSGRGGLYAQTEGAGDARDLKIDTGRLIVRDGAQIQARTSGEGSAGTLEVNASESVELSGTTADGRRSALDSSVQLGATGSGGNLTVETGRLIVQGGAYVGAGTFGVGSSGTLTVRASESVELVGESADGIPSGLFTNAEQKATGAAGKLTIETGRLIVRDRALVFAGTLGEGEGGNLDIATGQLIVRNGSQIATATFGAGSAGTLVVRASESVELSGITADDRFPSGLFTTVEDRPGATGNGGNLTVETGRLMVRDGARVSASTFGAGSAGTLVVRAFESVEVSGTSVDGQVPSLLTAQTTDAGDAGDLSIETEQLTVRDGAGVAVSSEGSGSAGNIEVLASSIRLNNQGKLTAESASGEGGNITLRSQDLLLLRNNSNISTTAGLAGAGGNGGNITIDTSFIVAVPSENSDITANAFTGNGGNIQIIASGIFGTQFRDRLTLESDITATSDFGVEGVVEINTPDVDPSQGIATLPAELFDASVLIASSCGAGGRQRQSEFIITGRGGLPIRPRDAHISHYPTGSVRSIPSSSPSSEIPRSLVSGSAPSTNPTSNDPAPIVEAQGWVINNLGEVVLTATAPNATPNIPWMTPATCHGSATSRQQPLALGTH